MIKTGFIVRKIAGFALILGLATVGWAGFSQAGLALASEREVMAGWPLSRVRLNAFRNTPLKIAVQGMQAAKDPQFSVNKSAIQNQKTGLPGRDVSLISLDGSYSVNYAGKKVVYYSAQGKTQAIAFRNSETYPQKTMVYAYPTGTLKTITLSFSPVDRFVFSANGELLATADRQDALPAGRKTQPTQSFIIEDSSGLLGYVNENNSGAVLNSGDVDNRLWQRVTYERKVIAVGQQLLKANHISQAISFTVLESSETNAFSVVPINQVYVTKKILLSISNDDELAGILGHEIAHVLLNHQRKLSSGFVFYTGRQVFRNENAIDYDRLQSQEMDADAKGVALAKNAGYNPWGLHAALQKIVSDTSEGVLGIGDHPQGSLRIAALSQVINRLEQQQQQTQLLTSGSPSAPAAMLALAAGNESQPVTLLPNGLFRIGHWDQTAARQEVLKSGRLMDALKEAISTVPVMDADFALHQRVVQGQATATDRRVVLNSFVEPYASLLKSSEAGAASYAVFFPHVRAYPTYSANGQLRSFSMCNQGAYPRSCYTMNAKGNAVSGASFEITESDGFLFDAQGNLLNYTVNQQTYNPNRKLMSVSKRF